MMSHRQSKLRVIVLLAGAALALVQFPAHSQGIRDLDLMDDQRLLYDIFQELTPVFQMGDQLDSDDDLVARIWNCLIDDEHYGDTDDITYQELEAEMQEAGTTLKAVIRQAVYRADLESLLQEERAWTAAQVNPSEDSSLLRVLDPAVGPIAQGTNGYASPRVAATDAGNDIVAVKRKVRR